MKWLTVAANKGYGPAQYHLGRMYARGQSVDRDHEQALAWFLKAEKSGYSPATQAVSKVRAQLENERQEAAKLAKLEESSRRNAVVQKPAKPESKRNSGAKKAGAVDARVELEGSLWTRNGEPAAELPSLFNDCKFLDERIVCMSRELTHFTDDADITYLMEATIANFGGRGAFEVSYRKNITQVLSSDMDDPDVSVPDIKLGWHTKRTMKCTFKKRNLVACKNDRNQIQAYSRQ